MVSELIVAVDFDPENVDDARSDLARSRGGQLFRLVDNGQQWDSIPATAVPIP